jgi:thymidylate synthase (FAD)
MMDYEPILENPKVEIVNLVDGKKALQHLERIGRTCYKSTDRITDDSYARFLHAIIDRGHEAMIEHVSVTAYFYTDRGVTHELVRHRIAAFAQSSTRYCNYSQDKFGSSIHVIKPFYFDPAEATKRIKMYDGTEVNMNAFDTWMVSMRIANWAYQTLTQVFGRQPQEARSVLPQSTAAEIYVTCNLREWRHIFKLRALGTTGAPHPDMRAVMLPALAAMHREFPLIFDDIYAGCLEKGLLPVGAPA